MKKIFIILLICFSAIAEDEWQNSYQQVKIKDQYKIIVEHRNAYGEKELAARIKIASKNLGWLVYLTDNIEEEQGKKLLDEIKPNFVLTLSADKIANNMPINYKRYYVMTLGIGSYFKKHWLTGKYKVRDKMKNLNYFDGFGLILPDNDLNLLQNYMISSGKKFNAIEFLPTVQSIKINISEKSFIQPRLYFSGILWDKLRKSNKYKRLYSLLSGHNYADFYGPSSSWSDKNVNYLGELAHDGNSYLNKIASYSIALILHSKNHLKFHIPTSRIFEAAAVGNLIICDNNQFIKDNFGDSVFYIDETKGANKMFKEIDNYMNWIRQNPDKAKEMAEKSHQIFLDKFSLEHNLINLAKMHESILINSLIQP
jgi:hypothetical protein